jgi:hypothetical protein
VDVLHLDQHTILTAMLAPALLMAATGSLLVSANARLARVVDRLRSLVSKWKPDAPDREQRDQQIARHRLRAHLVLRACQMLYIGLGCFVGTSLALAVDAFLGFQLGVVPTLLALLGVIALLLASAAMWREVSLAVKSFGSELDDELVRRRADSTAGTIDRDD